MAAASYITAMNVFFLDRNAERAARYHSDQHVAKMALEAAQILSTVLHGIGRPAPYRPTHRSHPSVLWAGESLAHYRWLRRLGLALCREYAHRFGRAHKCEAVIRDLPAHPGLPDRPWRDPPLAMPDRYHDTDAVAAYRAYYRAEKSCFRGKGPAKWTGRRKPPFMTDHPA